MVLSILEPRTNGVTGLKENYDHIHNLYCLLSLLNITRSSKVSSVVVNEGVAPRILNLGTKWV